MQKMYDETIIILLQQYNWMYFIDENVNFKGKKIQMIYPNVNNVSY